MCCRRSTSRSMRSRAATAARTALPAARPATASWPAAPAAQPPHARLLQFPVGHHHRRAPFREARTRRCDAPAPPGTTATRRQLAAPASPLSRHQLRRRRCWPKNWMVSGQTRRRLGDKGLV